MLGSAVTFLGTWFWTNRAESNKAREKIAEGHEAVLKRVMELEKAQALIAQTVQPLGAAYQAMLVKDLTHYHTPEMDALMKQIGPPSTLSEVEEARLETLLKERSDNLDGEIPPLERDAAFMLPAVMRRAKAEMERLEREPLSSGQIHMIITPVPAEPGESAAVYWGPERRRVSREIQRVEIIQRQGDTLTVTQAEPVAVKIIQETGETVSVEEINQGIGDHEARQPHHESGPQP